MTQEHKAPNLNLRKARGISQSVAPVIPVGYKRSAPDAPDTSDEGDSRPKRGQEAEAAGPKLDQAERQRSQKLRRMAKLEVCR